MKIQYITAKNIKLNLDLSIINHLKKLTNNNTRSLEIWKNANFSLINDNKDIVWTKQFKDITEEDINASIDKK